MNDTPTSGHTGQQKFRQELIDAILFRIEQAVDEVIPSDIPKGTRNAILDDILPNSRFVLEALTIGQLQNECSLDRHIDGAIATTKYFCHRIEAQRRQL